MREFLAGLLGGGMFTLLAIKCWIELIGRRPNTMQPFVPPPDAARDLSLCRSADRETLSEVRTFIESRIDWLVNVPEEYEQDHEQLFALETVIKYWDSLDLGPESSESQDAMEKA